MKIKQYITAFNPISIALVLSLSSISTYAAEMIDSETSVVNTAPEVYDNATWQAPAVVDFTKLDTSGNGLLMPKEASNGKAFNKKTFAAADTDKDGTIDQNEYVLFKTGKMPETTNPAMATPAAAIPDKVMPEAPDMKEAPMSDDNP